MIKSILAATIALTVVMLPVGQIANAIPPPAQI